MRRGFFLLVFMGLVSPLPCLLRTHCYHLIAESMAHRLTCSFFVSAAGCCNLSNLLPSIPCWLRPLCPAALPMWPLCGDTLPLEKSHGSPLHCLPSPHSADTRLSPGFSCRLYSHAQKPQFSWTPRYLSGCSIAQPTSFETGSLSSDLLALPLPSSE